MNYKLRIKKILSILALAACFTTGFMGCDRIPEDQRREISEELPSWQGQYVLLEDFTGVRCSNCPETTKEVERLKEVFGDRLIVIALHSQDYAFNRPIGTSPDSSGNNQDLRNAQAEEYRIFYNVQSMPAGVVMQKNEILGKDNFYGKILSNYGRRAFATVNVSASFNDTNELSVSTNIAFTDNYTGNGNTQLSIMILEDSLLVTQQTSGGTGVIYNYCQNHVLRAMATPIWGDQLAGSSISSGSTFNHTTRISTQAEWKKNKLSAVAILFDNSTKEVIQAGEFRINN
ncbi:MAG: Omp28-related outer membrane protein [Bacteroidales bacterium]|jgi:hypothetical protein|nr:Omp28-related outer membrane protein [Bacteroidales bacterium]